MMSTLEIDGRSLSSIKEAASVTTYSRDYITRLAREGKIVASNIGRQWFIDVESLKGYAESVALEQEVRKRQLSEERKRERQLRQVAESQRTLHLKRAKTVHARSVATAMMVLGFGLISGSAAYQLFSFPSVTSTGVQTAQVAKQSVPIESNLLPAQAGGATHHDDVAVTPGSVRTASAEQHSLGNREQGVLLLPEGGSTDDVSILFSDTVEVRQSTDGSKVVVPVDAAGNQVGNEIPFVVVPVSESES